MKNPIILGLSAIGLLFSSVHSFAGDDKYPATNFQPKVVYINKDLAKTAPKKAEFDPNYPAANFEPKVIYIDKNAASSRPASRKKAEFDPKYPAANFEPKVIFPAG